MSALVMLEYEDVQHSARLVNDKLHIPTVKRWFGLSSVMVDDIAEPTDNGGFTFATYLPGNTLRISGRPAAGVSNPFAMWHC